MSRTLLVIPHFNDTARLEPFLRDLLSTLPAHFSILVSDDGSIAAERERLVSLIKNSRLPGSRNAPELLDPIFTPRNTGKGGAVHRGWAHSDGFSLVAFTDADGAVSAKEILRAESYFRSSACEADALFASRVKMLGRSIQRTLMRHLSGRIFATLVSVLGKLSAYDTQCGLKILTVEAYQKIRPFLHTVGFAFDVELALLLRKFSCRIIEFPIDWADVPGSKINLLRDSLRMAMQVMKIQKRVSTLSSQTVSR